MLRCRDWPGLQCVDALTTGQPLEGFWRDRTREYEARRRGKEIDPEDFIQRYTLALDPLPCWRHLPAEEYRRQVAEMVEEIDKDFRAPCRVQRPTSSRGGDDPQARSPSPTGGDEEEPAPRVHAASWAVFREMIEALREFTAAYRKASARFRKGELDVEFPQSCFRPAAPHVSVAPPPSRAGPARAPG